MNGLDVALVTVVSQRPSTVIAFCRYHLALGVKHLFIYFDDPAEADIPELKDEPGVSLIPCDADFWAARGVPRSSVLTKRNRVCMAHGIALARDRGITLAALFDGDEFLYCEDDLGQALAQIFDGEEVVRCLPFEAVHSKDSLDAGDFAHRHFKVVPGRVRRHLARLVLSRIYSRTDHGFFGHYQGKIITRTDTEFTDLQQVAPVLKSGRKEARTDAVKLLHFDCMQFEDWRRKWQARFSGDAIGTMRPKRAAHHNEIEQAFEQGEAASRRLYTFFFLMSDARLALGRLCGVIYKPPRLASLMAMAGQCQTPDSTAVPDTSAKAEPARLART